ncbi:hypothetical protein NEOLI_002167 [Neolecta irregularis DAH-3]|uniref:Uncharacterized protein n=1 Tax=Neolecta irregularis (strain DAH-3) TaxID=1198029 RepID=A0A1U7LSU0_NEOID|nr:hypothetical protein NEOLI_002167 [Neolecta irregularis DAH-3]|eukprot:OLL25714.1 hypothetical protein NEOLI_002167 [Neolecta irregularis DAH-3]
MDRKSASRSLSEDPLLRDEGEAGLEDAVDEVVVIAIDPEVDPVVHIEDGAEAPVIRVMIAGQVEAFLGEEVVHGADLQV